MATADDDTTTGRPSVLSIILIVLGIATAAYGIWGAIDNGGRTHPLELTGWVVGADLAHDLLLAPVVAAVSWLVARTVPTTAQHPIRWALATSGVLALIAWPFVRGYGRNASVPSLLDRNYGRGLIVYLAVVWFAAGIWIVRNQRRQRDTNGPDAGLPGDSLAP